MSETLITILLIFTVPGEPNVCVYDFLGHSYTLTSTEPCAPRLVVDTKTMLPPPT